MWTRHGASRRGAALRSSARYAAVESCGAPAGAFHTQRSLWFAIRTRAVLAWVDCAWRAERHKQLSAAHARE